MTQPIVRIEHASHRFGRFVAVDRVTLDIAPGEIVGLIGANGAGKTTLIKMLLGLLAPSSGSISVFGGPITRRTREQIGYVPQGLGLYPDLTVSENLHFRADAYGVCAASIGGALGADRDRLVGRLPLGRQREVAFVGATQQEPKVLILDEPTSGVSPLGRSRLWDTIHSQAESGAAVLTSTHYMDEAEQADRLVMMSAGTVVASGSLSAVIGGRRVVVVDADDWAAAFAVLDTGDHWVRLDGRRLRVLADNPRRVKHQLDEARVGARVSEAPASLDEVMVLDAHDRSKSDRSATDRNR